MPALRSALKKARDRFDRGDLWELWFLALILITLIAILSQPFASSHFSFSEMKPSGDFQDARTTAAGDANSRLKSSGQILGL